MTQLRWLVTGCSSGLGEAFVRIIMVRGDKVVATCRGDVSRLSSLKEAGAETASLDVTAPLSDIKDVVEHILVDEPIDFLVNNAGYIEAAIVEETSLDNYLAQFETNFFGVIKTTQAVLPHFRGKKSKFIALIGSSGGIGGEPGAGAYCGTKSALEGWYDCLRQETAHLDNVKFRGEAIGDYKPIREAVVQLVRGLDGNQLGDPKKAVEIILDVVKDEGVAQGKPLPERLPLGPDVLATLRKRSVNNLAICNEWEEVIRSTNI